MNVTLTDGTEVPQDGSHTKLKANGQQEGYVVLSEEERAKGFVRPVRTKYVHVGPRKRYPDRIRMLTEAEKADYADFGYVAFEEYPESESPVVGRYWTQKELNGCGVVTTMGQAIAETYARDPKFYGGTFCCGCSKHFPLDQFVWDGTDEQVGS